MSNKNNNEIKTTITFIEKTPRQKIILFWTITVIANSLFGAFIVVSDSKSDYLGIAGMASAIISCIIIYSIAEIYLRQKHKHQLALELRISACIRIILQPVSDLFIGYLALTSTKYMFEIFDPQLTSNNGLVLVLVYNGFSYFYMTTMLHALFASLLVCCILGIIKLFIYLYKRVIRH